MPETPGAGRAVRRRLQLLLYGAAGAVAVLLTVVLALIVVARDDLDLSDRLAAVNDVFAGAALFVALTAGGIALQTYAAATGSPVIKAQVWFGGDPPNRLVLVAEPAPGGLLRSVGVTGQSRLHLRLNNVSEHPAHQITVQVRLDGLYFDREFDATGNEWRVVDATDGRGATVAEWSGAAVLHGHTTRRLPALDLRSIVAYPDAGDPAVRIHVASTGYVRAVPPVPVVLLRADQPGPNADAGRIGPPEWI
ncbi:hypothetical protein AMIS_53100 [Actinoplanes missouriensis 431]|uniref:Uncharacterized protein n=1 Tax=Actinoplanes missouriensis (strain ATCC 14538 / DSM 43046 / CBS 188.64 / JCM 3121 / NBRC 102363 / NCIMB 12654 / NRRL B-3342 / UNCC 431) TaxID=512565 RepID=I0HBZ3_ACTM4|nr:hypothetical protein [Actinoplanes missouriensis]BAL90530.1 hypothetical protein AMIS_53100 [Actinoplanes missouriensis 431]